VGQVIRYKRFIFLLPTVWMEKVVRPKQDVLRNLWLFVCPFCPWVRGACITCRRSIGGFRCGADVYPSSHARHIIGILQLPFFLASPVCWLFLVSLALWITLSLVHVCMLFETPVLGGVSSSFCGAGGISPSALQPFEAYCAKPRFSSPVHLQRRSTSNGVRDLYQRKEELRARNGRSNLA
jgi:hypothetical protein